jgi:hypothetical protein
MEGPLTASSCESLTLLTLSAFPRPLRATIRTNRGQSQPDQFVVLYQMYDPSGDGRSALLL